MFNSYLRGSVAEIPNTATARYTGIDVGLLSLSILSAADRVPECPGESQCDGDALIIAAKAKQMYLGVVRVSKSLNYENITERLFGGLIAFRTCSWAQRVGKSV